MKVTDKLMPGFAARVEELFDRAEAEGIGIEITSTYRSSADQAQLYQDYRRRLADFRAGNRASAGLPAAPPGQSYHEVGLAVDVVTDPPDAIERVAEIAAELGLRWGGDFGDPVHFDAGNLVPLREARKVFNSRNLVEV